MANNIMVKYVGPKKIMHVPFPADNVLPLSSLALMEDMVEFPRNQGVELSPARAEALLAQSPGVFKVWGPPIKAQTIRKPLPKAESNGNRDQDSLLQTDEPTDFNQGDGGGVQGEGA